MSLYLPSIATRQHRWRQRILGRDAPYQAGDDLEEVEKNLAEIDQLIESFVSADQKLANLHLDVSRGDLRELIDQLERSRNLLRWVRDETIREERRWNP